MYMEANQRLVMMTRANKTAGGNAGLVLDLLIVGVVFCVLHLVGCSRGPDISHYFGGTNNVHLIAHPESVTAWRTAAWVKGERRYAPDDLWRKGGDSVPVETATAVRLSKLLLDKRSYDFHPGSSKSSIAEPCVVVSFVQSNRSVDVFFSFADNSLLVKSDQLSPVGLPQWVGGDFDPSRAELVRIVKTIFASDKRMQTLSETRANGSLWPDSSPPE
jgi:hypothetical protein